MTSRFRASQLVDDGTSFQGSPSKVATTLLCEALPTRHGVGWTRTDKR